MHEFLARFRSVYGSHPLHLLTLIAGFALFFAVIMTVTPAALWNPKPWWQSIAVWFAAAVVLHDLVLFPVYSLVDRVLVVAQRIRTGAHPKPVPVINFIRVPALGAGLTLLVFLPGIIEQGGPTYTAATGQTQEPFLIRWLWLAAAMFVLSAVLYAIRLAGVHRKREDIDGPAAA